MMMKFDIRECAVMEELKTCPFCGGDAAIIYIGSAYNGEGNGIYFGQCVICKANAPLKPDEESAIAAWNAREAG